MERKIIYYGNPLLRKKAEPVTEITDEIRRLVADLEDTRRARNNGIGIAAPQVGVSLAIFLTAWPIPEEGGKWHSAPTRVFINPRLSLPSDESWVESEGCLSIPKVYAEVERPIRITVTAMDLDGREFTEEFSGWAAKVIMHENDHLNGVLFIDRVSQKDRRRIDPELRRIKKELGST